MLNPVPNAPAIEATSLSKTYRVGFLMNREVRALQDLHLSVGTGQIYGLLGPNGAGKSTTIKILMNLVRASSGSAKLFGHSPELASIRRLVGFLPENPSPYEYLSGREFVTLAGRMSGLSGQELDKRVTEVIGEVEMSGAERLQIRRYSKGMVQRIALAQALVGRPMLLILDEPTSGLDPLGRKSMRELIQRERARGTTILFCSHIIPDVEALCDRLAVLVGGKRVREGTIKDLLAGSAPSVEIAVDGKSAEQLRPLLPSGATVDMVDGRAVVIAPESAGQTLLSTLIASGCTVARYQPARFSLEQLFMTAVKEAGRPSAVGGEINA